VHLDNAVRSVICEAGSELRCGQIRRWSFFTKRASAEYVDIPKGA
jgi:hypothetical protein